MTRRYANVRPKKHAVYSVEGVLELYGISRNTLSNWVTSGLRPSDNKIPQVFRGAELIRFHSERVKPRSVNKLKPGEFLCLGCRGHVFPDLATVKMDPPRNGQPIAHGRCPDCGQVVMKRLNETTSDAFRKCIDTNTSLASIDEVKSSNSADIGKERTKPMPVPVSTNDRTILEWQGYADRNDPKTTDAHLRAIRFFESFLGQKRFASLTKADVVSWRRHVLNLVAQGRSRSTALHEVSHVKAFFWWLAKEPGYRHLGNLEGYFDLPKRFHEGKAETPREFPSMDEAKQMLAGMPHESLKQRRARAIFACAMLSGFRADALISMRVKHVQVSARKMLHDGEEMRAKTGKSFFVNWFPVPEVFEHVLINWLEKVHSLGLGDEDALFPKAELLNQALIPGRAVIAPMKSAAVVSEAFKSASDVVGKHYSPHSVRDCLTKLGDDVCRTAEESKAWSQNLGHSSEQVTLRYYAKVSPKRQDEIFSDFEKLVTESIEEINLILDYYEHRLARGDPGFERAEKLVEARRNRKRYKK